MDEEAGDGAPPPEVSDVGPLSRWLSALGESLTCAVRAGVPYVLLGERIPADHKLFKQRQWTSHDLSASATQLQHSFREQLGKSIGKSFTDVPARAQKSSPMRKSRLPCIR